MDLLAFARLIVILLLLPPPMDMFACLRSVLIIVLLSVDPSTHPECNATTRHIFPSIDHLPIIIILTLFLAIHAFIGTLLSKHTTAPHVKLPSASSPGCSASTLYPHYDVFINYRVPDLKHTLALPLYQRLQSRGLRVFLDQTEMVVGRNICDQIIAATSGASVHIALLSPNYAESAFCLDELVLVVNSGATIIPVFYDVDPCELLCRDKSKSGAYDKVLRTHEETQQYDSKRIQQWRDALADVAKISGLERKAFNGELELLHKVVQDVLKFFPNLPAEIACE